MSNALDSRDGSPTSDPGTRDGVGFELAPVREADMVDATSFDDGLFGIEPSDGSESDVRESIVRMAGVAGTVVAGGLGVGAWTSLGMPATPAGAALLGGGLLVAALFALRTRARLAD